MPDRRGIAGRPGARVPCVLWVVAALALGGCATPVLKMADPEPRHHTAATNVLQGARLAPSRNVSRGRILDSVNRVLPAIRSSAHAVCLELGRPTRRCNLMLVNRVDVDTHSTEINAFADSDDNIGVLGGLVRLSGSDAEVAAVLAHEFAHVMYDHPGRKMTNALIGGLLAGGLAALAARDSGVDGQRLTRQMTSLGMGIGATAYSPAMELEADRTAVYILRRAGYPTTGLQNMLVRMSRAGAEGRHGAASGLVGFLQTHPSDDSRIAHIMLAIEDARRGRPLDAAGR